MSDIAAAILNAVRAQRDEFLDFLEKLVVHESPSLVPESQEPIFELIAEALDAIGYEIRRISGNESGGQLLAAPSGSDFGGVDLAASAPDSGSFSPVQLLIGHCDTVWPIGTLKKMPVQIDDLIMRGPGVFDMKAGLAQTVFALQTLHRLDIEPALMPLVFINSDEEIGSNESAANIVRLAQFASRVFVMEPALGLSGKLKTGRKGVSQFVVNFTGKAAHAGLDP
ncbi:MAG TPA: M20/M25/M40 family metallo-hydrolase, partial [Acidobacteriota bacterium]|nr:M20/M25/M40 family metallo-hydrolase [Acidobacteriota bacterium]